MTFLRVYIGLLYDRYNVNNRQLRMRKNSFCLALLLSAKPKIIEETQWDCCKSVYGAKHDSSFRTLSRRALCHPLHVARCPEAPSGCVPVEVYLRWQVPLSSYRPGHIDREYGGARIPSLPPPLVTSSRQFSRLIPFRRYMVGQGPFQYVVIAHL